MQINELEHEGLKNWIQEAVALMAPDSVRICDGSKAEYVSLIQGLVDEGLAIKLNQNSRPDSFLFRSDPSDVARIEGRTFIASKNPEDAGPTNNWIDPDKLKKEMTELFRSCMKGRTMYVIPFSMGHIGSSSAKIGIEITDSAYVVVNMHIMTRVGTNVIDALGSNRSFVPCYHSIGKPLAKGESDKGSWPCEADINKKYIAHFPDTREIWSYGSGYGGNALLGKKCLALRIASVQARDEGWLAEHMLILKITNPQGEVKYIAGAFPSACGKTNLSMLVPTIPGWKVETIGDDIAWMHFGEDGRLYASNPETGFFGVAPGTSEESNCNAMRCIKKNAIFTNCGLTEDGDIWWEKIGYPAKGKEITDWKGKKHPVPIADKSPSGAEIAHPNARFTVSASQCPVIAKEREDPTGVPISAFLFGGRRSSTIPLICQSKSWTHGVFMGSICGSEATAAALDITSGLIRRDPFAMLPFCGYNMGDYFNHWISLGKKSEAEGNGDKLPKIFFCNWFRKDSGGSFLWPGYGENSLVLEWVFNRCDGKDNYVKTAIGLLPASGSIKSPLGVSNEVMEQLCTIDMEGWKKEITDIRDRHYPQFGTKLPPELKVELDELAKGLGV